MRRPGKEAAVRALQAQAAAIRAQERPTPSGEPHRISEPWPTDDRTPAERASGPSSDEANRAAAESE